MEIVRYMERQIDIKSFILQLEKAKLHVDYFLYKKSIQANKIKDTL